nr:immunoglobulin heavy chain junction region [Macaca mulatta]MOV42663.1 immunoglobulin heavy chain junction region [Macaca mulatta]
CARGWAGYYGTGYVFDYW